jgi:predicted O-methyltransferase YrrM
MKRDIQIGFLAALAAVAPGLVFFGLGLPESVSIIVTIGSALGISVAISRRWYRQTIARLVSHTTHLRGAIGIAATAGGIATYWTEHSITPESLTQIQQLITTLGARKVLELGSGLSTLLIANSFRKIGEGSVLSFDDDARWAAQTIDTLVREKVDIFAEVRVAALKDVTYGGRTAPWYDLSKLDPQARFDLVIVDGPPAWKGDSLARLPALYALRDHLSEKGVLILDDAGRPGEREIARKWQQDFPGLYFKSVNIGRGLFVVSVQEEALDLLAA